MDIGREYLFNREAILYAKIGHIMVSTIFYDACENVFVASENVNVNIAP